MKRLWIAVGLLLVVFFAMLWNTHFLNGFTSELAELLTHAEASAEQDDWDKADTLTQQAYDKWEAHSGYLHIMLRHSDTDQIHTGFREVREFINCQEGGEYSAANAKLIAQIELLYEAEQLSIKNIL